ncbi:hypothetical protein [Halococcus thailandensis]|uniref:hypothetical protein n=1 Tax=Halococcus thailandensis TaxID=335952 RepID=UPI00126940CC|nr:hypothetical protein [Halococcus thailandensis]
MASERTRPHLTVRPPDALEDGDGEPEFIRVSGDPSHVWLDGLHLVETTDRRVEVGKYYYLPNGEGMFVEILDIEPAADTEDEHDPHSPQDERIEQIDGAMDEVSIRVHYYVSATDDQYRVEGEQTDVAHRYGLEADFAINMGDIAAVPYVPVAGIDN